MKDSIVDNSWICGCGALNAPWLKECGRCKKEKSKDMEQRQFRSRQGRSDKQYEDSLRVLSLAGLFLLGAIAAISLLGLIREIIINPAILSW